MTSISIEKVKREVGEEAWVALVVVHVAYGVYMHERADRGDDYQHHGGQLVYLEPDVHVEVPERYPGVQDRVDRAATYHVEAWRGEQERAYDRHHNGHRWRTERDWDDHDHDRDHDHDHDHH